MTYNHFPYTSPLWGESTSHLGIPLTKGPAMQSGSFDYFFVDSLNEFWTSSRVAGDLLIAWTNFEQVVELTVIWDAMN